MHHTTTGGAVVSICFYGTIHDTGGMTSCQILTVKVSHQAKSLTPVLLNGALKYPCFSHLNQAGPAKTYMLLPFIVILLIAFTVYASPVLNRATGHPSTISVLVRAYRYCACHQRQRLVYIRNETLS